MAELTSISLLVTTCAAACVAIITAVQNSRCTKINACCITCVREPVEQERPMPHDQEQSQYNKSRERVEATVPLDRVVATEGHNHEA